MNDIQKYFSLFFTILSNIWIMKSFFNRKKNFSPQIIKLIIYPIKSLQGVEVKYLEILKCGVKWDIFRDRTMVLLDEDNKIITQRNKPQLSLIKVQLKDTQIHLDAPDMETLKISYEDDFTSNELITFKIWGSETEGFDCGQKINQWFTKYLKCKTKMVKFIDGLKQCKSKVFDKEVDISTFYQDGFPILLINQASINDLNKRLNGKLSVTYRNFRPNFLIDHTEPYEEDRWNLIEINEIEYQMPKPCDRCQMITVDPDRGVKSLEPLHTLKTYRVDTKWSKYSPLFGINLAPLKCGKINVGDDLKILK